MGSAIMLEAFKQGKELLQKADAFAADDAKRYAAYLEAARAALHGLEQEYQEIVVEANHCQLDRPEQVAALRKRIEDYLHVKKLREILDDAVMGVDIGRATLEGYATRWYLSLTPAKKQQREQAVVHYADVLNELKSRVRELDNWPKGATGFAVDALLGIDTYLGMGNEKMLREFIASLRVEGHQEELTAFTGAVRGVIEELLKAFR